MQDARFLDEGVIDLRQVLIVLLVSPCIECVLLVFDTDVGHGYDGSQGNRIKYALIFVLYRWGPEWTGLHPYVHDSSSIDHRCLYHDLFTHEDVIFDVHLGDWWELQVRQVPLHIHVRLLRL